jgi:hypothetical protein
MSGPKYESGVGKAAILEWAIQIFTYNIVGSMALTIMFGCNYTSIAMYNIRV